VSIAPAAAAKRYISLCGCVHHLILAISLFDRQYIFARCFISYIDKVVRTSRTSDWQASCG